MMSIVSYRSMIFIRFAPFTLWLRDIIRETLEKGRIEVRKKRKKKSSKSFFLNSWCSLLKGFSLKQCCLQMRVRIRLWKTRKIPQAFAATAACRIKGQLLLQIVFNDLVWIEEKREDKSWKCLFLNSWCRLLKGFSLKQCCLQIRVWIRVWKPWKTPHCAAEH